MLQGRAVSRHADSLILTKEEADKLGNPEAYYEYVRDMRHFYWVSRFCRPFIRRRMREMNGAPVDESDPRYWPDEAAGKYLFGNRTVSDLAGLS